MTKSTGVGRGGRRAGAGRKPKDRSVIAGSITVTVDQETVDLIVKLGEGNLSLGVRKLARAYMPASVQAIAKPVVVPVVSLKKNPFLRR